jgi:hypothetical protein
MVSDITDGLASAAPAQAIRGARQAALAKPRRRIDWNIVIGQTGVFFKLACS